MPSKQKSRKEIKLKRKKNLIVTKKFTGDLLVKENF